MSSEDVVEQVRKTLGRSGARQSCWLGVHFLLFYVGLNLG
jgi:hypothetical protein